MNLNQSLAHSLIPGGADISHCNEVNPSETKRLNPSSWERDPVCGGIINFNDARGVSIFKKSKYYFCGSSCLESFENNPSAYANKDEEEDFIYFDSSNYPVQIKNL